MGAWGSSCANWSGCLVVHVGEWQWVTKVTHRID